MNHYIVHVFLTKLIIRARGTGWRHWTSAGTHQVSVVIVKGR